MKSILKIWGAAMLAVLLSACALPRSEVNSGTQRPSLAIIGAPVDATLHLDGLLMGSADQYDGKHRVLNVEEGLHTVVVEKNGSVLHSEKIYVAGGETSKVQIGGGER